MNETNSAERLQAALDKHDVHLHLAGSTGLYKLCKNKNGMQIVIMKTPSICSVADWIKLLETIEKGALE